jgi:hypothetical protein
MDSDEGDRHCSSPKMAEEELLREAMQWIR